MIKRAVIGYLIQWSSHSWYDILFRRNYAAPTAPHVFIASSTHVKLKSSLCTWYSIIARRNRRAQWENVKAGDPPCLPRRSARRHHRALMHAQGRQQEFEYWTGIETFPSSGAFSWHISLVRGKGIFTNDSMCVYVCVEPQKSRKLCKIQNRSMFMCETCIDAKTLMTVQIQATCFFFILFNSYKFNWTVRETLGRLKFSNF